MKNYRDPEKVKHPGQEPVSMIVPDYKLNRLGELEEVGKIDLQEIIDSNVKSTLDAILDKYINIPNGVNSADRRMDIDFLQDDLDGLMEAKDFFDECRERYNRPNDTEDQIIDFLNREVEKNKKKGVSDNEIQKQKENQSEEEPAPLQENGKQSESAQS